jgi:hypothetical protein
LSTFSFQFTCLLAAKQGGISSDCVLSAQRGELRASVEQSGVVGVSPYHYLYFFACIGKGFRVEVAPLTATKSAEDSNNRR